MPVSPRLCTPVLALLTAGCIAAGDRASESGVRTEVIDGVEHVVHVGVAPGARMSGGGWSTRRRSRSARWTAMRCTSSGR